MLLPMPEITDANVQATYRRYAPMYDLLFGRVLAAGRARLGELVTSLGCTQILEVGVGTGLTLPHYPATAAVTGVDISSEMLAMAAHKVPALKLQQVTLVCLNAETLPFPDASFDCVTLPYVLSVTPHPTRLVSEVRRVCKPGGDVLVLNHFSGGGFWGWFEPLARPLAARIGFSSDFSYNDHIAAHGWTVMSVRNVNLLNLSKLVHIRNG